MTRKEKFELEQRKISNEELIEIVDKELKNIWKTRGRSIQMSVPPSIKDTDMLIHELVRRFKDLTTKKNMINPRKEYEKEKNKFPPEYLGYAAWLEERVRILEAEKHSKDKSSNNVQLDTDELTAKFDEMINRFKDCAIDFLTIEEVAAKYGEKISCELVCPNGVNWSRTDLKVSASLLKQMEQGTIRNCS